MKKTLYSLSTLTGLVLLLIACGNDSPRHAEEGLTDEQKAVREDRSPEKGTIRATFKVANMVQSQDAL